MVAKDFNIVFEKIPFSPIVIDNLGSAKVCDLKVFKKSKTLEVKMINENIIDERCMGEFKNTLIKELPGISEIKTYLKYNVLQHENVKDAINLIWSNIMLELNEESPFCKTIMNGCTLNVEGNNLTINIKNNAAYFMTKRGFDKIISSKIFESLDLNINVCFKDIEATDEEKKLYEENALKMQNEIMKQVSKDMANNENKKTEKTTLDISSNLSKGIIIGREITGSVSKIIDTKTEGEKVIIEGFVFGMDAREIKGEKYIVSFNITDNTDSTTVKFFIGKEIFDNGIRGELKDDAYLKVKGDVQFDKYSKELNIMSRDINKAKKPFERMDNCENKRVELHLHTQMSSMDGVTNVKEFVKRAAQWGHKAIAVTDHGVVQAFPDAMLAADDVCGDLKKNPDKYVEGYRGIKIIYGVEAYIIDDLGSVVLHQKGQCVDDEFVVFDIETTGFSKEKCRITEIGAVRVVKGEIKDSFSTFVNPQMPIPNEIVKLTNITDDMVKSAPLIEEVIPKFLEFVGDSVLVAHNASFDMGFIKHNAEKIGICVNNTVLDTLDLSKSLLPELSKYKLNIVAKHLNVSLNGHHRAVNDAQATAEIFIKLVDMLKEKNINTLEEINIFASQTKNYKALKAYHAIMLVKNYTGLRNLYELVSKAHIDYFYRRPRIPKSEFIKLRDGILLGSACEAGELYRAILDEKSDDFIDDIVSFYDYLEIQPTGNNRFMIDSNKIENVNTFEDIENINKRIISLAEKHNKLVAATCDVHFIDPEDAAFRKIIMAAEGFSDADNQAPLYFRTTEEMLDEFRYLGEEKAKQVVITNTNKIADMIENIKPIPDETFPPKIEGAEEELRKITMDKAILIYGNPLPEIVSKRLEKELNSIIKNGFSVLYIIAQKLVWKSVEDGYLVGSRGSVGSSFVANMAGITEVNSLPPHYICRNCKYSDFDSEDVKQMAMQEGSGCDMPDKVCPVCGSMLDKDGHDIPFETFLGFDGDKEPDIDLNFSGDYQQTAHAYTEELFGKGHVFKAGTIGTLADKTAYGFVKKYMDERNKTVHNAEISRLVKGCTGIKRTTGQHPGGLMVVPNDHDIYEFCPIQRPANDVKSNITTTHFDYHSISGRLLKLDLLGHDDPTVIRMLYDITGVNPQSVSLGDKQTMSLFESPKALGVTKEDINCETGTLGIPEFGTKFVRQMLLDTKPKSFADLLRISGLSHGTDVWINNAQELISKGTITLKETISTRDSIMIYLINKGMDNKKAFKIMEQVRKGKGLKNEDIEIMESCNVPQWYIQSCLKIKYMFPKAHAAAYVMMAFRIAYYKINYPQAYYASYFTVRACDDFDYSVMCKGIDVAKAAIKEIEAKGMEATTKDKNKLTVLEIIVEYYARGFKFVPIDLYKSDAKKFIVTNEGLMPPFSSLQGLGVTAAQGIVEGRKAGEFKTIEGFKERTGIGKTLIGLLKENNVLKGIPETNQLTLF